MKNQLDMSITKDRLIAAGIRLFSRYGYEATSTRMIAREAGVNIGTIAFHFGNKEQFYRAVLEFAAEDISALYEDVYQQVRSAKSAGTLDKKKAWELICKLVDVQLNFAIDQPQPDYLSLLYWEQIENVNGFSPIADTIHTCCEDTMAFLLTRYAVSVDHDRALLISLVVNRGIVAFTFLQTIKDQIRHKPPIEGYIKKTLRTFFLSSIVQYCSPNADLGGNADESR
jgi:AcrR family transcriptional regulator